MQKRKAHLNTNRKIVLTADGSKSIFLKDTNVQYHSKHGAILEAQHVFIKSGLHYILDQNVEPISIFEMGFGTGLNSLLTNIEAQKLNLKIDYTAIEAFPVELEEALQLNYPEQLTCSAKDFKSLHEQDFNKWNQLNSNFNFRKILGLFQDFTTKYQFNLIYYDAFGATAQPELWSQDITDQLFRILKKNGVVVTYSVKGSFRRSLLKSGFTVQKIPGPPGKREMLRAIK